MIANLINRTDTWTGRGQNVDRTWTERGQNVTRALFICSRNRLRSPTAEHVFANRPGVETDSAGLASDATVPLSSEQIAWAEIIFVMEKSHRSRLTSKFSRHLGGKRVVCLDIPDNYAYMQPELIDILETKARRFFPD